MSWLVIFSTLLCVTMWAISDAMIYLETEKQSGQNLYTDMESFDFIRNSTTTFTFEVMAASNAHVALLDVNKHVIYEIYIGGYTNTKSQIRYFQDNSNTFSTSYESYLLSSSEYREFRVNWTNKIVTVEKHSLSWSTFLDYTVPEEKNFDVHDVGVSTSMHDTGEWKIPTYDNKTYFKTPKSLTPDISFTQLAKFGFSTISTSLVLEVKSCSVTFIRLENPTTNLLVTLGASSSNTTNIHSFTDARTVTVQNNVDGQFIDCFKSVMFRIRIDEKNVSVDYKNGCHMDTYLTMDNALKTVDTVNFAFGSSMDALWKIHNDDYIPICEEANTGFTTTVESTSTVTDDCSPCQMVCVQNETSENATTINALIKKLKQELTVPITETSNFIRTKISAPDERQSAAAIGYTGTLILATILLIVVVLDINTFINHFRMLRQNICL